MRPASEATASLLDSWTVAGFEPLTKPEQLPPEGTALETLALDFKRLVPKDPDQAELAKDVAAFANGIGAVLLVGAVEDASTGPSGATCR